MILQNISKAIREQNYYAVALEFVIVIAGVVIGAVRRTRTGLGSPACADLRPRVRATAPGRRRGFA